jgi:MFS family permease
VPLETVPCLSQLELLLTFPGVLTFAGRIWATRQLCVIWIVGVIIYITSAGNYGQVLAGRFIMGLGIGQTTVVAPAYLAEAAPRSIRGLCICIFSGSVYLGIMLGYFANWGTSLHISSHSSKQWYVQYLF